MSEESETTTEETGADTSADTGADAGGGGAAGAGAGGGSGTEESSFAWLDGASEETLGFAKTKNWKDPAAVVDSYRNLEKVFGADRAGRTVAIPGEGASEDERNAFYEKLGRPESPDKYEISVPENTDGSLAEWAKGTFHKHGLTAAQAKGVGEEWNQMVLDMQKNMEAEYATEVDKQRGELRQEWGAAYDQKVTRAKAAIKQFGVDDEAIDTLEQSVGYGKVMRLFAEIGEKIGEDTLEDGSTSAGSTGALTPAEAKAQIDALYADKEFMAAWQNRQHPGHKAAIERKSRLARLAVGESV